MLPRRLTRMKTTSEYRHEPQSATPTHPCTSYNRHPYDTAIPISSYYRRSIHHLHISTTYFTPGSYPFLITVPLLRYDQKEHYTWLHYTECAYGHKIPMSFNQSPIITNHQNFQQQSPSTPITMDTHHNHHIIITNFPNIERSESLSNFITTTTIKNTHIAAFNNTNTGYPSINQSNQNSPRANKYSHTHPYPPPREN